MKRLWWALMLLPGCLFGGQRSLFDGTSLDGWKVAGAPCWTVVEGVLVGQSDPAKKGSILWTDREFGDLVLSGEIRFAGDIDSGVFLREENEQIQIGVSRSLKRDMTGSPYIASKRGYPAEARGVMALLRTGEWNRFEIGVKGRTYTVSLNGTRVLEYRSDSATRERGPIGLQVHPGVAMKIEFRGLAVGN